MTEKYIYDIAEGDASMKSLLGGKGAGVAEMMRLGVPVPDGFTVTTTASVICMGVGGSMVQKRSSTITGQCQR